LCLVLCTLFFVACLLHTNLELRTKHKDQSTKIKTSPFDCAFFRSINLRKLWRIAKKITFNVIEQESLRVRISQIQSVVIDDLSLLLQPSTPTWLANLLEDSLPQFVLKRRECESRPLFTAVRTFDPVSHV